MRQWLFILSAALALTIAPLGVAADDTNNSVPSELSIELDSVAQLDGACRVTFIAQNKTIDDISSLVVEAVAFAATGGVQTISLFDFQNLPALKLRVRQFDLSDTVCADLGRILINGVQTCDGPAANPESCQKVLSVSSRSDVELLG